MSLVYYFMYKILKLPSSINTVALETLFQVIYTSLGPQSILIMLDSAVNKSSFKDYCRISPVLVGLPGGISQLGRDIVKYIVFGGYILCPEQYIDWKYMKRSYQYASPPCHTTSTNVCAPVTECCSSLQTHMDTSLAKY